MSIEEWLVVMLCSGVIFLAGWRLKSISPAKTREVPEFWWCDDKN